MGAVLMNHAVIGKGSVVAAGTVILEKTVIPAYSLVTGVPGRIKKTYDSAEAIEEDIQTMSEFYMKNALEFSTGELFYKIHNRQTKENIYGKA
jgi:carbonic anhydrase/acetyltransferase-like protein (isoleucine patch superfamily)